jgi:hypothetical protein
MPLLYTRTHRYEHHVVSAESGSGETHDSCEPREDRLQMLLEL